jgi:hypothetical protein
MREIWIPELLLILFLILSLVRPFFKGLWAQDGLSWLPLISLLITIGIFPAYGFRPELLPLLVFNVFFSIINIPNLIFSGASRPGDDFRDENPLFTFLALVLLVAVVFPVFAFSPRLPPAESGANSVQIEEIRDERRNRDYFLRIYGPSAPFEQAQAGGSAGGPRPIIFLSPPEAGSVFAVDQISRSLGDRGFTVISWSRRGFDFPAGGKNRRNYQVSPAKMLRYWRVFRKGTFLQKANEQGQSLETGRLEDIEFLLGRIRGSRLWEGQPLILVGFGAGGSALAYLAETSGFTARFGNIKGIIAVESRFWSAYRSDTPVLPQVPAGASRFLRLRTQAANWFRGLGARKTSGFSRLPRPTVPALYLVSDRALNLGDEKSPYRAVFEILRNSNAPAALAALEGAGPLDYSDYPLSHPVYSFLFPGRKSAARNSTKKNGKSVEDTANIIGNFSAMLLEADVRTQADALNIPEKHRLSGAIHTETRSWNLPDLRYILSR